MATMKSITARGTRLEQLKQLAKVLAAGDEIGEILAERENDGKPGAVRTHRAGVPGH